MNLSVLWEEKCSNRIGVLFSQGQIFEPPHFRIRSLRIRLSDPPPCRIKFKFIYDNGILRRWNKDALRLIRLQIAQRGIVGPRQGQLTKKKQLTKKNRQKVFIPRLPTDGPMPVDCSTCYCGSHEIVP